MSAPLSSPSVSVSSSTATQTPMMQQYMQFRTQLPADTLLFFRLGDFFELFFEDAKIGSNILGLTLTQRGEVPMAGIPAYTVDTYTQKLLQAHYRVAICDQVEQPQAGKLIKRALTRILTPGTSCEAADLEQKTNQFLLSLDLLGSGKQTHIAASWADVASGEIKLAYTLAIEFLPFLMSIPACEVLIPENARKKWALNYPEIYTILAPWLDKLCVFEIPPTRFDATEGALTIRNSFQTLSLKAFGIKEDNPALGAVGAILYYTSQTFCQEPTHFHNLSTYQPSNTLVIDPTTLRGLEVFKTSSGDTNCSLFQTINHTISSAGSRLLETLLQAPLLSVEQIQKRQAIVSTFVAERSTTNLLRDELAVVRDISRILTRLKNNRRFPRELGGLRHSLSALPALQSLLESLLPKHPHLEPILSRLIGFETLQETLQKSLEENLPQALGDSPTIATGIDIELDHLRTLTSESVSWLAAFEAQEQLSTGIKNLKIKHHGSLGYCIEVTKANLHLVPAHYIRRQSTTNAERFTTEALREKEREVFSAKDKVLMRETVLFEELVQKVLSAASSLYQCAEALAYLDVFLSLAEVAFKYNYTCPQLDTSRTLEIKDGRHPTIEAKLANSRHGLANTTAFTPNSLSLGEIYPHIALITGPNMAGKSTFIRQTALIVLLAQIGSWVPASQAHIGIVDRLFARIGASDELSRGHSTFMVEMAETAHLLHQSTPQSLILLDEVGRGTSTYDGLSLAWAITEHLHQTGTRTLFATHYHELTQLEGLLPQLKNLSMLVHEEGEHIHFLHQVKEGAASRSYGIHVAKLAGVPKSIIERAQTVLSELEAEGKVLIELLEKTPNKNSRPRMMFLPSNQKNQLRLFEE